jgi:hypothetical protein
MRTIRTAATYLKKAAQIIYDRGDGALHANGMSERAFSVASSLRSYGQRSYS